MDLVLPNRPLPTLGWCCGALATGRWGSCRRRDEGRKETGAAQSGEDMEKVVRWRGTSGGTSLARRVSVWREQLQPVAGTGRASMPSFEKIPSPQILPHARALPGGLPRSVGLPLPRAVDTGSPFTRLPASRLQIRRDGQRVAREQRVLSYLRVDAPPSGPCSRRVHICSPFALRARPRSAISPSTVLSLAHRIAGLFF